MTLDKKKHVFTIYTIDVGYHIFKRPSLLALLIFSICLIELTTQNLKNKKVDIGKNLNDITCYIINVRVISVTEVMPLNFLNRLNKLY